MTELMEFHIFLWSTTVSKKCLKSRIAHFIYMINWYVMFSSFIRKFYERFKSSTYICHDSNEELNWNYLFLGKFRVSEWSQKLKINENRGV